MSVLKRQITVLELLTALALIFILVGVSLWVLNPFERLRQDRDNQRLADMENLRKAVDLAVTAGVPLAKTMGVPSSSASVGATQVVDGAGWLPMDLSGLLDALPVDPANGKTFTDVLGSFVTGEYQFVSDGKYYVLRTHLEAEANRGKYAEDKNDNSWWEAGTAPGMSTFFGL